MSRREAQRAWYRRNRAKVKARALAWKKANPEKARAIQRKANHRFAIKKAQRIDRRRIPELIAELRLSVRTLANESARLSWMDTNGVIHREDERSAEEVIREWKENQR